MVGGCGGTNIGTYASPPFCPVFHIAMNVVNECCMKSLRPAFYWKWTYQSVRRATTATKIATILTTWSVTFNLTRHNTVQERYLPYGSSAVRGRGALYHSPPNEGQSWQWAGDRSREQQVDWPVNGTCVTAVEVWDQQSQS